MLGRKHYTQKEFDDGRDANPLNEVELLADSMMNHDGVLRVGNVIKWIPDQTVLKLKIGDAIRLPAGIRAPLGRVVLGPATQVPVAAPHHQTTP